MIATKQEQVDAAWAAYIRALRTADAHAAGEAHATRHRRAYAAWKRKAAEHTAACEAALAKWEAL